MTKEGLNKNELDIMYVLWDSDVPLLASEIVGKNENLTIPTVQRLLKSLVKKEYVEVADIVQNGKALGRRYRAKKTADDFLKKEIEYFFPVIKSKRKASRNLFACFFESNHNNEMIDELQKLIDEKKREWENGD
ncbi:MAG: BlaI/MecI/CopY family transcriptional regulator [Blautia sp.]|uniref:BlaI/MecI/CopY family transcriptional regulator n=1 Tax=Blautia sp. TaxID=1955243 RepID=UPI002E776039|nr:BlaI/MecI/CopY family transcriptional regulator [Blautia sp.]MEE1444546.1 BlaI/MecI/CopY family transcriptional regulator [Blautia sp.]